MGQKGCGLCCVCSLYAFQHNSFYYYILVSQTTCLISFNSVLARHLHSSIWKNLLLIKNPRTVFASRAFCNVAPVIWNSLPHQVIYDLSCSASFHRNLKHTFIINLSVTDCCGQSTNAFIILIWLTYVMSSTAHYIIYFYVFPPNVSFQVYTPLLLCPNIT